MDNPLKLLIGTAIIIFCGMGSPLDGTAQDQVFLHRVQTLPQPTGAKTAFNIAVFDLTDKTSGNHSMHMDSVKKVVNIGQIISDHIANSIITSKYFHNVVRFNRTLDVTDLNHGKFDFILSGFIDRFQYGGQVHTSNLLNPAAWLGVPSSSPGKVTFEGKSRLSINITKTSTRRVVKSYTVRGHFGPETITSSPQEAEKHQIVFGEKLVNKVLNDFRHKLNASLNGPFGEMLIAGSPQPEKKSFQSAPSITKTKKNSVQSSANERYTPLTKKWAVVIGISNYLNKGNQGVPDLVFADDDARVFADTLLKLGWNKNHIKLLVNSEATQRNIMIALESWLTKAGPDDMIVLFWAGHGFPDPEDPEKVYFACYDTEINIPVTGYRMDRVRSIIEERKVKNVILLADTCHAGKLITRGKRNISIIPNIEKMRAEQRVPKGWIFMVGADTDRQAIEHSSWSNGAFTHSLIKGLKGSADGYESAGPKDGVVTIGELKAYMNSEMPYETQKVLGVAKRPVIATSTGDPDIWNLTIEVK